MKIISKLGFIFLVLMSTMLVMIQAQREQRSLPKPLTDGCAKIQWSRTFPSCVPVPNVTCDFWANTDYIQLDCSTYRVDQYYTQNGTYPPKNLTTVDSSYFSVGRYNYFTWNDNTYLDPSYDPQIQTNTRWSWSLDLQTLYSDSVLTHVEGGTSSKGDPTVSFTSSTTQYTLSADGKYVLSAYASVTRDSYYPGNVPQASSGTGSMPTLI